MSLACSSLSIGNKCAVVSLEKSFQELCCYFNVDLILIDIRTKDLGRVVELLLSSFGVKGNCMVVPALKHFFALSFFSLVVDS